MARQVFQLSDAEEQPTRYVGITDDGETMRVYVGHFFSGPFNTQYATAEGDPMNPLWRGPLGDWSQDIIDGLDAMDGAVTARLVQAPAQVKRIVRRRKQ